MNHITKGVKKFKANGSVRRPYARRLWNFVIDSAIDSFNEDIDNSEISARINRFQAELDRLVKAGRPE